MNDDSSSWAKYYDRLTDSTWATPNSCIIDPEPYRVGILEEAKSLITGDRNMSYGSPTQNFTNTADLWTVQFGHKLKEGERFTASDIAQAQILLKMARMIAGSNRDHWVDVAGYAGCGAECEYGPTE